MRSRHLALLGLLSVASLGAGWFYLEAEAPEQQPSRPLLFPALSAELPGLERIDIRSADSGLDLRYRDQTWVVEQFDGYPALPDKVKALGLGLAGLRRLQPKTQLAERYSRLGVEGVAAEGSRSVELRLEDAEGKQLAELIVGLPRKNENRTGLYVRQPGDPQSWLVAGSLQVSAEPLDWIERRLFDIPASALAEIRVQHADGDRYRLYRTREGQENFTLEPVPPNMRQAPAIIVNKSGTLLQDFSITGVRRANNESLPQDTQIDVRTFSGLSARLAIVYQQDEAHARIHFTHREPDVAAALNQRLDGWVFTLPDFKGLLVRRKSSGLSRPDSGA